MASVGLRRLMSLCSLRRQTRTFAQSTKPVHGEDGPFMNGVFFNPAFYSVIGLGLFVYYILPLEPDEYETDRKKVTTKCQSLADVKPNTTSKSNHSLSAVVKENLLTAGERADIVAQQCKEELGTPGLVIAASVDGKVVWSQGYGFADVENNVKCTPDTVMRIASISKSLTATALARLWQEGKLDLDAPIQQYVPEFPVKTFGDKPVVITSRNLMSHLGGIRHYQPKAQMAEAKKDENQTGDENSNSKTTKETRPVMKEMYIKEHYDSVIKALEIFKNDPLDAEPGTEFIYTTHGWTLLSAVVEGAAKTEYLKHMKKMFLDMGMFHTEPEVCEKIIHNRARFYTRDKKGRLVNTPYVDNSYKWAGGGFISTVGDLIKFGNVMLYSSQRSGEDHENGKELPGILEKKTVDEMWTVNPKTKKVSASGLELFYGLGWEILSSTQLYGGSDHLKETKQHTGQAVGASSIIYILPNTVQEEMQQSPPKGVVVAILANTEGADLRPLAIQIAKIFDNLDN